MLSLKEKVKMCAILNGNNNICEFSKFLGLSNSFISLLINNKTNCRNRIAKQIIEKTQKFGKYAITMEDLFPLENNIISSDQNNITNKKINVKNSASEVVSSDLKADDVG